MNQDEYDQFLEANSFVYSLLNFCGKMLAAPLMFWFFTIVILPAILHIGKPGTHTNVLPPSSSSPSSKVPGNSFNLSSGLIVQASDGYANLRNNPSTKTRILAKIPNGTPCKILGQETNSSGQLWYKVKLNGRTGWIFSGLIRQR